MSSGLGGASGNNKLPALALAGFSVTSVRHFTRRVNTFYVIRQLLNAVCSAAYACRDPAMKALGQVLVEILEDHDVTLVSMREYYLRSFRRRSQKEEQQQQQQEQAYSGSAPPAARQKEPLQAIPSLAEVWSSTSQQRQLYWHLLSVVADAPLLRAVQAIDRHRGTGTEAARETDTDATLPAAAAAEDDSGISGSGAWPPYDSFAVEIISRYLTADGWLQEQGQKTQTQTQTQQSREQVESGRLCGWNVFGLLESRLREQRVMVEEELGAVIFKDRIYDFMGSSSSSSSSSSNTSSHGVPSPLAHMVVTACILRRVSTPLLHSLERLLFQLESESPGGNLDTNEGMDLGSSGAGDAALASSQLELQVSLGVSPSALLPAIAV